MSEQSAAMAVLEETLEFAVEACREANEQGNAERAFALFEVIDLIRQQADVVGLDKFANKSLNRLDPYSLLASRAAA
jgi:hypothetical protein